MQHVKFRREVKEQGHCSLCRKVFAKATAYSRVDLLDAMDDCHYLFCAKCVAAMARAHAGRSTKKAIDRHTPRVGFPGKGEAVVYRERAAREVRP